MTIDEQIAVLEAYKAGKRINYSYDGPDLRGSLHIDSNGMQYFNFQDITYTIARSFIIVNGVEVPEPVRVMPETGTRYYYPKFIYCGFDWDVVSGDWDVVSGDDVDYAVLKAGVMHLTEAAARQHYEALILPSKQK